MSSSSSSGTVFVIVDVFVLLALSSALLVFVRLFVGLRESLGVTFPSSRRRALSGRRSRSVDVLSLRFLAVPGLTSLLFLFGDCRLRPLNVVFLDDPGDCRLRPLNVVFLDEPGDRSRAAEPNLRRVDDDATGLSAPLRDPILDFGLYKFREARFEDQELLFSREFRAEPARELELDLFSGLLYRLPLFPLPELHFLVGVRSRLELGRILRRLPLSDSSPLVLRRELRE
eukprot:CAMPEP_0115012158 /NCGR_PEP_ID=MMETSP0216-20121206/24537_1 /TAXON_ID=223996 /ORGANISM="Protocruzia adherens, Strain Boccale" /LENGTH=228 /DNA_ID=CAMNT_0002381095 /DNA_START=212 /DNA_END=898 /DNA_ORIENTATION=-